MVCFHPNIGRGLERSVESGGVGRGREGGGGGVVVAASLLNLPKDVLSFFRPRLFDS